MSQIATACSNQILPELKDFYLSFFFQLTGQYLYKVAQNAMPPPSMNSDLFCTKDSQEGFLWASH